MENIQIFNDFINYTFTQFTECTDAFFFTIAFFINTFWTIFEYLKTLNFTTFKYFLFFTEQEADPYEGVY